MAERFIKLYDKILKWEWYKNINVKVLFLHLLLKANYKDLSFEGHKILRGQLVTSLPSLSAELGMTTKQIRGSLEHLISTGEVTSKTYPRYRIITIIHYDDYQSDGRQNGSQRAGEWAVKGQAEGRQTAGSGQAEGSQRAASIEYIEQIEDIEKVEQIDRERKTAKRFTPPTKDEIEIFCLENGLSIDVNRFINHYESNGWMVGKNKMKNWQATVRNWAARDIVTAQAPDRKPAPALRKNSAANFEQRDYSDVPDDDMARLAAEMEQARKDGII